jgi:hypothetical protein
MVRQAKILGGKTGLGFCGLTNCWKYCLTKLDPFRGLFLLT